MWIETFSVPPLGCNCTVIADEAAGEAIVVDPGGDAPGILKRLADRGLRVTSIVHTHTHIDHVGATAAVQRAHGASARIHADDLPLYEILAVQGELLGMRAPPPAELDRWLTDGEVLSVGALSLEVLHTPGHTPGSVCFHLHGAETDTVLAGDTLFAGSIGRTDLWGGDSGLILKSIQRRLLSLDDDTRVITGHDRPTTIGHERRHNPFLRGLSPRV